MKKESAQKAALWDKRYKKQDTSELHNQTPDERLVTLPHPIRNMLDIGCGTGDIVHAWAKKKVHATGLDISKNVISLAKRNTPAPLSPYCHWFIDDWDTMDPKAYQWEHSFDLVYSCMGPDFSKEDNFKKLNLLSRKYIRLLLFKTGSNSLLENLRNELQIINSESSSAAFLSICKMLKEAHYNPEIRDISYKADYTQSVAQWLDYIDTAYAGNTDKQNIERYLLSVAVNGNISSVTRADYSMITWEV